MRRIRFIKPESNRRVRAGIGILVNGNRPTPFPVEPETGISNRSYNSPRVVRKRARKDALAINRQTAVLIRANIAAASLADDSGGYCSTRRATMVNNGEPGGT